MSQLSQPSDQTPQTQVQPSPVNKLNERSLSGPEELGQEPIRVSRAALQNFTVAFFTRLGLSQAEAAGAAEILVTSDLRGIESHGVPRLEMYLNMFRSGLVLPNAPFTIIRQTPVTALVDGNSGLGLVVGRKAMNLAIEKAQNSGIGLVAVTNSSHFGIAGFYAEMALAHDMIGLAMTNSTALGVPTFGLERRLGSNPIAFAAPAKEEFPFLLDMATSIVAMGKLEIAARQEKPVPLGWGLDQTGQPSTDPLVLLDSRNMMMLGSSPQMSSHKGYGLATMVDVLVGVLSGMGHSYKLPRYRVGQFFGAIRIDCFREVDEFKAEMDEMIRDLHSTPTDGGAERVFVAGEKEYLAQQENLVQGIPLHPKIIYRLTQLAKEFDILWNLGD